jgi:hypothetical protein
MKYFFMLLDRLRPDVLAQMYANLVCDFSDDRGRILAESVHVALLNLVNNDEAQRLIDESLPGFPVSRAAPCAAMISA